MVERLTAAGIVWRETQRGGRTLKLLDGRDPIYLRAVIGNLALKSSGELGRGLPLPAVGDPQEPAARAIIDLLDREDIKAGQFEGRPLPSQVVIWPVGPNNAPLERPEIPEGLKWIRSAASTGEDYVFEGQPEVRYRLWTRTDSAGGVPLVSAITSFGLANAGSGRRWYQNFNWWLGIAAALVFFVVGFSVLWTAASYSQAYDLLAGNQVAKFDEFAGTATLPACTPGQTAPAVPNPAPAQGQGVAPADANANAGDAGQAQPVPGSKAPAPICLQAQVTVAAALPRIGLDCIARLAEWGAAQRTSAGAVRSADQRPDDIACQKLYSDAAIFASSNLVVEKNGLLGAAHWLFGWQVRAEEGLQAVSLGLSVTLTIASVVLLLVALGRGFTGRSLGALMTPEGRYSLALAQVTFWTVLIFSSVYIIAVFNDGIVAERMRDLAVLASSAADAQKPSSILEGIFPKLPGEIWAVLGITVASPFISALIKSGKRPEGTLSVIESTQNKLGDFAVFNPSSGLAGPTTGTATIADWFTGEEAANQKSIDISRVQMVLVTATLLVTYGYAILALLRDISAPTIVAAIDTRGVLIESLPAVGVSMAGFLLFSHATYLVAKAAPK